MGSFLTVSTFVWSFKAKLQKFDKEDYQKRTSTFIYIDRLADYLRLTGYYLIGVKTHGGYKTFRICFLGSRFKRSKSDLDDVEFCRSQQARSHPRSASRDTTTPVQWNKIKTGVDQVLLECCDWAVLMAGFDTSSYLPTRWPTCFAWQPTDNWKKTGHRYSLLCASDRNSQKDSINYFC